MPEQSQTEEGFNFGTVLPDSVLNEFDRLNQAARKAEEVRKAEIPKEEIKKAEIPTSEQGLNDLTKNLFVTIHGLKDRATENDSKYLEAFSAQAKSSGLNTGELEKLLKAVQDGTKIVTRGEAIHIERISVDELVAANGKALSADALQRIIAAFPKHDSDSKFGPYENKSRVDRAEAILDPRLAWFESQVAKASLAKN